MVHKPFAIACCNGRYNRSMRFIICCTLILAIVLQILTSTCRAPTVMGEEFTPMVRFIKCLELHKTSFFVHSLQGCLTGESMFDNFLSHSCSSSTRQCHLLHSCWVWDLLHRVHRLPVGVRLLL